MVSKESTPFHFWSVPTREYPQAGVITALYKDDDGHIVSGVEGEGVFKITSEGNITDHCFQVKRFHPSIRIIVVICGLEAIIPGFICRMPKERTFYVTGN